MIAVISRYRSGADERKSLVRWFQTYRLRQLLLKVLITATSVGCKIPVIPGAMNSTSVATFCNNNIAPTHVSFAYKTDPMPQATILPPARSVLRPPVCDAPNRKLATTAKTAQVLYRSISATCCQETWFEPASHDHSALRCYTCMSKPT